MLLECRIPAGSFGITGGEIDLPADIRIIYPFGQSLDETGIVQVDSNHLLAGGVQPDIRVPTTFETAQAIYVENMDVVLDVAIDFLLQETLKN